MDLIKNFADIAPLPRDRYDYSVNSSDGNTFLVLAVVFAVLWVVSLSINIVLGILLIRARRPRLPQAETDQQDVTRSSV
ncbi:MAG: hypothetical protein WAQ22_02040 [Candidatus Saccharimonas sp.]